MSASVRPSAENIKYYIMGNEIQIKSISDGIGPGPGPKAPRPEAIFLSPARSEPDFFQPDPSLAKHAPPLSPRLNLDQAFFKKICGINRPVIFPSRKSGQQERGKSFSPLFLFSFFFFFFLAATPNFPLSSLPLQIGSAVLKSPSRPWREGGKKLWGSL